EQFVAHRHGERTARALDEIAFDDLRVVAENHHADLVFFQVQRHAVDAAGEFQHFLGHAIRQAFDAGDTVTALDDFADFLDADFGFEIGNAPTQHVGYLFGIE